MPNQACAAAIGLRNIGADTILRARSIEMRNLNDKVAWITGAGTGIGEAAARALVHAGMKVVLSGRRREPLDKLAAELGGAALSRPLDVADKDAVLALAAEIVQRFGRIDVLVNSAGLNARNRNWHNVTLEDWDRVIRVDLDGSFYCSKAVLPTMVAQQDGLIVNVSSWAGKYTGILTGPAYSAAKHAMNSMTESLNMEAGIHGVRACALCPGEVATPILDSRPIPVTAEEKARMLQAEDCGEIIAFIARMPPHVCINELTVSPTWNRGFVAQAKALTR
jgi:NADP-dependent 3-hydroxy acid dehydrogenase YdfG